MMPPLTTHHERLIDQVNGLRSALAGERVSLTDMSRAGALETSIGADALNEALQSTREPVRIVRIESDAIEARPVAVAAPGATRFRFFLDGSQKTIPVGRVGLVPLVVALSAAGILERDPMGVPSLRTNALQVRQPWVAPRLTSNAELNRVIAQIEMAGGDVHDPFLDSTGAAREDYHRLCGDYGRALTLAFDTAGRLREELERQLAAQWEFEVAPQHPDTWMVIDGRLPGSPSRAIGLVKSLQTQLLSDREAVELFDLPQGHRTTAFRYASNDGDMEHRETTGKTMWYVRLWSAHGQDARHSLVRIETSNEVSTTEQIDEITGWILAERLPRATDDPRWPTLLYPISYLERILKRRLASITAGWPSA
jgi:hypothetical protein